MSYSMLINFLCFNFKIKHQKVIVNMNMIFPALKVAEFSSQSHTFVPNQSLHFALQEATRKKRLQLM